MVLQVMMVRIYAESLNSILTLILAGFCCSFNSFKIRVKTLSTIGGIPISLLVSGMMFFGSGSQLCWLVIVTEILEP